MKRILLTLFLVSLLTNVFCQTLQNKVLLYTTDADAKSDIHAAVSKAALENKQVLIQVGGNWCSWCIKLHQLFDTSKQIDSLLKADYIYILVNYSKENKNLPVMKDLGFPQRFGFPVLVILDKSGNRIHTQDTGLLESGDGYDASKVFSFLKGWNVGAMDPQKYQ